MSKVETGKRTPTRAKGVYVYTSTTDTDPKTGKPDQAWTVTYRKLDDKGKWVKKWEKIGWASEGYSLADAVEIRANRVKAIRHGEELPVRDHKKEKVREKLEGQTVDQYWTDHHLSYLKGTLAEPRNVIGHYTNWIKPEFGERIFATLTQMDVDQWVTKIKMLTRADQTKRHIQLTFSKLFEMAARHGVVPQDLFDKVELTQVVKGSNNRTEFLSPAQMQKVWDALKKDDDLYRAVLVSTLAGLRREEIIQLKNSDVRLDAKEILLKDTKNGTTVHHPISDELVRVLTEFDLIDKPEAWFLCSIRSPDYLTKKFRNLMGKLGFNEGVEDRRQRLVLHSLRHTFCSWLLSNPNVSIKTAMVLSRHASLDTIQRYTHVRDQEKRQAINGIDGFFKESLPKE